MARQKNISNSKPIEKADGIYSSLMELDRDIKVEKEKNSAIKQSPIRQSLMAAEKSNFQEGGMMTVKSKDGTVTNVKQNPDGSKTVQVKTKDGKYFEKIIPMDYWGELDQAKEKHNEQQSYKNGLNYLGIIAYPAAIVSSGIDARDGNYGDAAIGLVPYLSREARASQLVRRNAITKLVNMGVPYNKAKYVRPAIDYTTKALGLGATGHDLGLYQDGGVKGNWKVREELYDGEDAYFKTNPHVGGMAAEDDTVILNPYSKLSKEEKEAIVQNEKARLTMRNGYPRPNFDLTEEQAKAFGNYSPDIQDQKETVVGRILSGDPSQGEITKQQKQYAEELKRFMDMHKDTVLTNTSGPRNFQDGGVKDNIIYPPGDSEYMDQPSYNYDIIEMLNQKARRGYEQYMHDQTDPTNINRASPAYQQKFQMREGMISVKDGGVIVDSEGQYSHPGKNTLIPDAEGRITMKDVKTPVLGIDDQGNSTIMQPEEEYQFQGNSVLEIPITGDIDSLVDPTRIKAFKKLFSK